MGHVRRVTTPPIEQAEVVTNSPKPFAVRKDSPLLSVSQAGAPAPACPDLKAIAPSAICSLLPVTVPEVAPC
jgi:hypothetical protein